MSARLLSVPEVCRLLNITKPTLWSWRKQGKFPEPIFLSAARIAWSSDVVDQWIAARASRGDFLALLDGEPLLDCCSRRPRHGAPRVLRDHLRRHHSHQDCTARLDLIEAAERRWLAPATHPVAVHANGATA